jgi:hypothetical protein
MAKNKHYNLNTAAADNIYITAPYRPKLTKINGKENN